MSSLLGYLNPISRLGNRRYSRALPFLVAIGACVLLELAFTVLLHNPEAVGIFAIFVFVSLIIYFSFRDGVAGGAIVTGITISYYFYIIYSRHYVGEQLSSGVQTTLILALLYLFLSGVIGGLKQKIDFLIEREADGRQRLQAIVQQLPVGVIVTDKDGVIQMANKRADLLLGTPVEIGFKMGSKALAEGEYEGRPMNGSESVVARALAANKTVGDVEYIVNRPDGKKVHLLANASVIQNYEGKTIAAAAIFSDVTAHREMEQRKDDFVNMASHELKTPITSMKLYVEILLEQARQLKDEKVSKVAVSIAYQTDRLQKLVSDLLDVSRLQTGKMSFSKEIFRLDTLMVTTINELKHLADDKKIVYTGKLPLTVYADKLRIYQVITNLITNAIKYSPDTQLINISARRSGQYALVSVQDFGIGIEPSQKTKIFERLYQVNDDRGKTFPGFGMGLYISKAIIQRHRGRIWVESEVGKGSTFCFTLPLRSKA